MMNIKSINSPLNVDSISRVERDKEVKSQESSERDADGRRQGDNSHEEKRHLSDEEIQSILRAIQNHEGVKANNLRVSVERLEDTVYFLILDTQGNRIKRLNSTQAWMFSQSQNTNKGHLVDKVS
ncbi:MAG: hypothetical protein KDD50_04810 [Bdellovibrionales bacterium]|nr:hypothetical protein [Bdellovibrionales bacterium]